MLCCLLVSVMPDTLRATPVALAHFQADSKDFNEFHDLQFSDADSQCRERFYREWQERLAKVDFQKLNQTERVDYILLRNHLTGAPASNSSSSRKSLNRRTRPGRP